MAKKSTKKAQPSTEKAQPSQDVEMKDPESPIHEEIVEKEEIAVEMLFLMDSGKSLITRAENEENEEDGDMLSIPERSSSIDVRAYNLHTVIENPKDYPGNYTVRSSWSKFLWIKEYLNKNKRVEILFRKSCFGHFLDLVDNWVFPGMLCHYMLCHSVKSRKQLEMWFIVDNKPLCFGMKEFALVTGLNCGPMPCKEDKARVIAEAKDFSGKILAGRNSVNGQDLEDMLGNDKAYSIRDKYKICLILFIHYVLMAKDPSKIVEAIWISFVNDCEYFNSFPWGKSSFELTIECLQSRKMKKSYDQWRSDKNHLPRFNLQGFPWAFMVWVFEAIPLFTTLGDCLIPPMEDSLRPIPRMLQYHLKRTAKWNYDTIESLLHSNEVVVYPFLTPSKREMRERFISSFEERDDYSDDNIDRLKKSLEGVTKLTTTTTTTITTTSSLPPPPPVHSTPPPVHSPPPPSPSSLPPPPPSSAADSQAVELLKMLTTRVEVAFSELGELSKKVEFAVGELREMNKRVDFAVGELGKLRKEFDRLRGEEKSETEDDFVQQKVEVRAERERKRSRLLQSPYTAEGALKKTKIVNQKLEIPQNVFMSISDEKRKLFYRWYNQKGSSRMAIGYNGEYDRNFFNAILNVGAWFDDMHLHEGLSAIRHKQRLFPQFYAQDCAVLDAYFHQCLDGLVERLLKAKPSNPVKKGKKVVKAGPPMSMIEVENYLLEKSYNTTFDDYFKGRRPRNGRAWAGVRKVYAIIHVAKIHWITIVWLLDEGRIEVLDCNRVCYKKEALEAAMWGPSVVFPKLLKASGQFNHLNQEIFDRQWKYTFVDNLPSNSHGGDCGIYSLEFVEFHLSNTSLDGLNDARIPYFRERLAIDIFQKVK